LSEADETLVARSQQGNRAAFEELVRRTARLVFSRIYLETGDTNRTEDLSQETYLIAWRSIRQVSEAKGFRLWLMSVAHSVVVDAVRREARKKRSGARADGEALMRVASGGEGPAEAAEKREERERALAVLRGLPEEYRMPLMMRYIAGYAYTTIERELGLSNGSLRGMLSRGMGMLREEMTKRGGGMTNDEARMTNQ